MAITNATTYMPSSAAVPTRSNYVSTMSIHKPQNSEDFIKRYGTQNLTGLMETLGNKAPVAGQTYRHWEEDYIHNTYEVHSIDATDAASGIYEVAVDGVSMKQFDGTNSGSGLRLGDVIEDGNGFKAIVAGIRTHAAGMYPTATYIDSYDSTNHPINALTPTNTNVAGALGDVVILAYYAGQPATAPADGDVLVVIGNEWAEGTDQPKSILSFPIEYTNKTIIMKESFEVTGSEATNVVWMKVQGPDGKEGYLWYLKGENDTYRRFQNYMEMMMLLGESASNAEVTGANINGQQGLLPFIEANGSVLNYAAGTFNGLDVDDIVKAVDRERGAKENALYAGLNLSLELDDTIAAYSAAYNGGAQFGTFANGEEMALKLGFKSFTRGGYTFHKSTYDPFSYQGMLGAAGTNYEGYGFLVPMDTRKDARTGDSIPSLRIRYKEAGGYSREMEHWFTGSAVLQDPTEETDRLKCHYRTERGFEGYGGNRFVLIKSA